MKSKNSGSECNLHVGIIVLKSYILSIGLCVHYFTNYEFNANRFIYAQ